MPRKKQPQDGNGLASSINKAINTITAKLPASDKNARKGFPGERHAILKLPNGKLGVGNFIGPGTAVVKRIQRGDPPRTPVDRVARQHDVDYMRAGRVKDKTKREQMVRAADVRMVRAVRKIEASKTDSAVNIAQAKLIIAKMKLEDTGLLSKSQFQKHDPKITQADSDTAKQAGLGKKKGKSSVNPWISHVKKYQKKHGCSYKVAMREAKATYRRKS